MIALFIYLCIYRDKIKKKYINLTSDFEVYSIVDFGLGIDLVKEKLNDNFPRNFLDLYTHLAFVHAF